MPIRSSMEDESELLRDVFGGSSDEEENEEHSTLHKSVCHFLTRMDKNPSWERIEEISGLWICRDFLSSYRQSSLLSSIENEGWFTEASHNQAMRFGDLPLWAILLSDAIREVVSASGSEFASADNAILNNDKDACILPPHLLWREPFFDQLIVNVYQPGEGICAHVDLMRFEDGIAIVSLESPCIMHFSRVEDRDEVPHGAKVAVYLNPGSLVIMWGEARYVWKHEISRKAGIQVWEGKEIDQSKRTSITLRKLRC